jgi:archaellum component FlaC
MLNGLQVLGSIDQALQQALRESEVIDREVSHLTERLLKLRDDETRTYGELARLRLNTTDGSQLVGKLSHADQQLKALIEQRRIAAQDIELSLNARRARLAILRTERDRSQAVVEEKSAHAQAEEDRVRAELEKDADYVRQKQLAEQATQTARFASQKTGIAENDRATKGKPYEDDPLFMYLWGRGYGTREYRANPLSRAFDALVARHVGYQASRPNYAMLQEIPKRLAEHATHLKEIADREMHAFMKLEVSALGSGESGQRRKALDLAREELDKLEDEIEALEAETSQLLERKNILARGEDESTKKAFNVLEDALRRTDIRELWEAALGTPFEEDDAAVRRLELIHSELRKVQSALENQKSIQVGHQNRLQELERVRKEYRRGGYGRDAWDFRSSDMLSVLLGEMLRGAITRDVFWDNMRRHQRPMPGPFDSMGGGSLGWPEDSGGGFIGGSGDFGDSDFRSGGGF